MMFINRSQFFFITCAVINLFCAVLQAKSGLSNKVVRVDCDLTHQADPHTMQLGKMTFYFEREPIVNCMPSKEESNSMVFFFPQASIAKDIHASLMRACSTAQKDNCLTVQCEKVKKPIEGIRLVFTYDAAKVAIDKKTARSLLLEPGVAFSFYNKNLIDRIKNQTKSILNISYEATGVCFHGIKV